MQDNFVIAIPSKGRTNTGVSFRFIRELPPDFPVYIYTDENEQDAYKELCPNAVIIPHGLKDIVLIRRFIQEHQHDLNNNFLMLDDDIDKFVYCKKENPLEWFDEAFVNVAAQARQMLKEGNDFIFSINSTDQDFHVPLKCKKDINSSHGRHWMPLAFACVGMTPKLYDLGIRYNATDNRSEDIFITVETLIAQEKGQIKTDILDACYVFSTDVVSHFRAELYHEAVIQIYLKYGYVIDFLMSIYQRIPYTHINKKGIKAFIDNGEIPIYHPYYDKICAKILKKEFYGHEVLKKAGWKPAEKYHENVLAKIDRHKEFHDDPAHYGFHNGSDFLYEIEMYNRVCCAVPAFVNEETFAQMRFIDEHGNITDIDGNII